MSRYDNWKLVHGWNLFLHLPQPALDSSLVVLSDGTCAFGIASNPRALSRSRAGGNSAGPPPLYAQCCPKPSRLILTCSVTDDRGFITHLSPFSSESSQKYIHQYGSSVRVLPAGSFLFPTFCDLHLHAPQFMYQGTGLDLPLMEWLDNYAYKAEEGLDQDAHLATKVYRRLAQRLIEVGTGAVLLFGTIKTETK